MLRPVAGYAAVVLAVAGALSHAGVTVGSSWTLLVASSALMALLCSLAAAEHPAYPAVGAVFGGAAAVGVLVWAAAEAAGLGQSTTLTVLVAAVQLAAAGAWAALLWLLGAQEGPGLLGHACRTAGVLLVAATLVEVALGRTAPPPAGEAAATLTDAWSWLLPAACLVAAATLFACATRRSGRPLPPGEVDRRPLLTAGVGCLAVLAATALAAWAVTPGADGAPVAVQEQVRAATTFAVLRPFGVGLLAVSCFLLRGWHRLYAVTAACLALVVFAPAALWLDPGDPSPVLPLVIVTGLAVDRASWVLLALAVLVTVRAPLLRVGLAALAAGSAVLLAVAVLVNAQFAATAAGIGVPSLATVPASGLARLFTGLDWALQIGFPVALVAAYLLRPAPRSGRPVPQPRRAP